jgi:hypothetical protein
MKFKTCDCCRADHTRSTEVCGFCGYNPKIHEPVGNNLIHRGFRAKRRPLTVGQVITALKKVPGSTKLFCNCIPVVDVCKINEGIDLETKQE